MGGFLDKLRACTERNRSTLCVGLDPEPSMLPAGFSRDAQGIVAFNRVVIEATKDLVCAYKPNLAFYEAHGSAGVHALEETLALIPPHVPTIGDAKRGDVPNTARLYAQALFGAWGFDSATVSPYLGLDSLEPFFEWPDKGVWVLCRTSNAGAADLQALPIFGEDGAQPLFVRVLRMIRGAPSRADKGLVVGATAAEEIDLVHAHAPGMPLLMPGVGAQGGDVQAAIRAARSGPVVVNASRSILYAADGVDERDVRSGIRCRATELRDRLNGG